MDTIGQFSPHHTQKKLSQAELRKMRHNMKQVPVIQQKSDNYHKKQSIQAEKKLQNILEKKDYILTNKTKQETQIQKSTLRKKIWNRFIDNFHHKPYNQ